MKVNTLLGIFLFALFSLVITGCIENKNSAEPSQKALETEAPPHIEVDQSSLNLGTGKQGEEITGTILLLNSGDAPLQIKTITPSCGCTVAKMSSKSIAPHKSAALQLSLDTRGKKGDVYKNIVITSNDPAQKNFSFEVHAKVEAPEHGTFKMGDDLFSGSCKSCHYDRAGKKRGGRLYMAICAFCHGMTGEGHKGSGPALHTPMTKSSLRYWIENGKKGTAMSAYAKKVGGPLESKQVTSLVEFISQRFYPQKESLKP